MKKVIILLVLCNLMYAGDWDRVSTSSAGAWLTQGYIFESINGTGFTRSIYSHVANLGSTNPAAIYDSTHISLGLSYQLESAIKPAWILDINHERGRLYLPQSAGIVLPLKNFQIGLGFNQHYNSVLDFGTYEVTTAEQPEGTGETFKIERENYVNRYSVQVSYALNNPLQNYNSLSLGLRLNYSTIDVTDRIYHVEAVAKGGSLGWAVGLRYDPTANIKIGLCYERNPNFNVKIILDHDVLFVRSDTNYTTIGNNPEINALAQPDYRLKTKLPDKLNLGFLYRFDESLQMILEITDIFWYQQDEESLNSFDISGSLVGRLTENISLSAGILSTERRFEEKDYYGSRTGDNLDALFVLAGLNLKAGAFNLDFALLTALVHGEWREQRIGKFSMGYSF